MEIIHEYDFAGHHYGLVELDDGSKIEIKDPDPLARVAVMVKTGAFAVVEPPREKILSDYTEDELVAEIQARTVADPEQDASLVCRIYAWVKSAAGSAWAMIVGKK